GAEDLERSAGGGRPVAAGRHHAVLRDLQGRLDGGSGLVRLLGRRVAGRHRLLRRAREGGRRGRPRLGGVVPEGLRRAHGPDAATGERVHQRRCREPRLRRWESRLREGRGGDVSAGPLGVQRDRQDRSRSGAGHLPAADDRRPGRPRRAGEHGPRGDDPGGLASPGGRAGLPRVPVPARAHRGVQRIPAGLHSAAGFPRPRRPAHRGDDRVLRRGPHLPGPVGAGAQDHPGLQLRAGHGARGGSRPHPEHHGRGLGAHRLPCTGADQPDEGVRTMSTTNIVTAGDATRRRSSRRVEPIYYFFLVPTLVLFTLAITLPGAIGIFFSFTDSIGIGDWSFNGLTNYIAMFSDPAILQSYLFTFGFSIATVIVVNLAAFLLAVGLTSRIRFKTGLRTVFVIPMVISGIIIAYVFNFLFSNSIPAAGAATGISWLQTSLLANPDLAWVAIVIVTAWQAIPGTMLIYIAGLLSVPGEVYEAASIDGASKAQQLARITVPLVAGYVVINIILGFKGFLNAYDIIVGLTNGGPGTATRSVAMTIIAGINGGDYAYQMANATIFFIVAVLISLLQLSLTRGRNAL